MRILVSAAALAALALPGIAQATERQSFTKDGRDYSYVERTVNGKRVIRGTRDDGTTYRFVVGKRMVFGNVDGEKVRFER